MFQIKKRIAFMVIFGLFSTCCFSQENQQQSSDQECEGGVCLVNEPPVSIDAQGGPIHSAATGDLIEERRIVDLTQEPWLVESANLPLNHPALKRERMLWANSVLWSSIGDIMAEIPVEQWITPLPEDLAGKYVLIEFWATWCPACRRSIPYLNFIQEKYRDQLVVVSICETDEEAIRNMPGSKIDETRYSLAIDTGRRLANKLGVYGIPHAILLEPMIGGVVWEGMPTLPNYELDAETIEKYLTIGQKLKEADRLPKEAQVKFILKEATDEERATRRKHPSEIKDEPGIPSL
ncbi:MAG: TlpA disulfide reductase family protein [Planctomycetia bacterium]|nr:TlpA disulfide reductase family protein [Planctomycetia bacterium]